MSGPEKSAVGDLAKRLAKLWKSPAAEQAKKTAAPYVAKGLAKLNDALERLNVKK